MPLEEAVVLHGLLGAAAGTVRVGLSVPFGSRLADFIEPVHAGVPVTRWMGKCLVPSV